MMRFEGKLIVTRALKAGHTRNCCLPSSNSTILAPGYFSGPLITSSRITCTLWSVTGSGKVNLRANTGGIPISFGSIFTSGEITERAAKLTRLP